AGVAPPSNTIGWLRRQPNSDGGFSFAAAGGQSDVDDTGAALEALGADRLTPRAVRFLRTQQNPDGGFPSQAGGESNAQSTAWAVQGLLAAGVNPAGLRRRARSPLSFLRSMTASDGHVRYSPSTDQTPVWVTAEAALALAGRVLPLAAIPAPAGGSEGGSATAAAQGGRSSTHAVASARSRTRAKRLAAQPAAGRSGGGAMLLGLASEAGAVSALLLAPVGVG
ncbi:MAG: hypothetical protein ACXVQR_08850, partial [Solirubrobacteraceae bacterium]